VETSAAVPLISMWPFAVPKWSAWLVSKESPRLSGSLPSYTNPLTPNDPYRGRTAPLTSKCCILYIYSTNIGTEYFKHGIHYTFFSLQNAVLFHNSKVFGSCIIHILYTGCAKIKK